MMTTDKEMIELCAKALGMSISSHIGMRYDYYADENTGKEWSPRTDQADSDNMACDLEIETRFCPSAVVCWKHQIRTLALHDGTTEGRRAAAREARALVAAEMGRVKL